MEHVFYTVNNHSPTEKEKNGLKDHINLPEYKNLPKIEKSHMKELVKIMLNPKSRGLTDEEIEKFQNLFKAAVN